jgi:hypothetical protein
MCRDHHAEQHRCGELTFWDHVVESDPDTVIEAFIKASPKRAEIERIRKEREQ